MDLDGAATHGFYTRSYDAKVNLACLAELNDRPINVTWTHTTRLLDSTRAAGERLHHNADGPSPEPRGGACTA